MESIQVSLTKPVYGIREMPVRCFFMEDDRLKIVFNEPENHKLNIGQTLSFTRYVYDDNDMARSIIDNVAVLGFDTYEDDGQIFDCIYTTIPIKKRLTLDYTPNETAQYWDMTGIKYERVQFPTVDVEEYVFDYDDLISSDTTSLSQDERDALPQHLYIIDNGINGIQEYSITYQAGTIPGPEVLSEFIIEAMLNDEYEIPEEYMGYGIFEYIEEVEHEESIGPFEGMDSTLDHLNELGYFDNDIVSNYYVATFTENHNIFQQDIDVLHGNTYTGDYYINVYDEELNKIGYLYDLHVPYVDNLLPVDKTQTITEWEEETCGMFGLDGMPYNIKYHKYAFLPSSFSTKSLIIGNADTGFVTQGPTETSLAFKNRKVNYLLTHGFVFEPRFTPYFYTVPTQNGLWCTFWGDIWWDEFNLNNGSIPQRDVWFNSGDTRSVLTIDNSYWNVPTIFSSDDNFTSLNTDEDGIYGYINNLITESLPGVIDFERIKYKPVIISENEQNVEEVTTVSEIIYRFHFRKRVKKSGPEYDYIDEKYRPYEDGWYINQDSGSTIWWNEMNFESPYLDNSEMGTFVEEQEGKSDLLGYLNFTDDDVFFSKSKIKNSFVRFSFYTSKDPVTQKLLYYSTTFLDANELRGKYLRLLLLNGRKPYENETPFVFTNPNEQNLENRLDTTIKLTHEYNSSKSSDGFNIYLFKDDAPVENTEKTIYMKVEFNHAGNGKTIPMILWPKNQNGIYQHLTTNNFLDNLYIPIKIKYIDGEYVYSIGGANIDGDKIELVLFEPKLDIQTNVYDPITANTADHVVDIQGSDLY